MTIAIAVIVLIVIVVAFLFLDKLLLHKLDPELPTPKDAETLMNTISLPSGKYRLKDGVDNYLVIGLDSKGQMASSESYTNTERADFLILVSVDHDKKACRFMQINRDTMAYVPTISVTGKKKGVKVEQIALAHTYGDGMSASCFNTVDAVSNLLYGVDIDYYVAMTMDAVVNLTDFIGGVDMTMQDNYTEIDWRYTKGANVHLNGESALNFVRERRGLSDATNIARQKRQNEFIDAFVETVKKERIGQDYITEAYQSVSDYILTNANTNKLYDLLSNINEYKFDSVITPKGTAQYTGEFVEFYIDADDLEGIIKNLFC